MTNAAAETKFWNRINTITQELMMGLYTPAEAARETAKAEAAYERKTGQPAPTR